jgi:hypothetical protein
MRSNIDYDEQNANQQGTTLTEEEFDMYRKWQLITCEPVEWKQDDSKMYTLINKTQAGVRLDVMFTDDQPCISFEGKAEDVRKAAMRYADENCWNMSAEHTAYIGWELHRAEIKDDYIQD